MESQIRKRKFIVFDVLLDISKNKALYLFMLPGLLYFLLFAYLPMAGIIVAFKDYKVNLGIMGSKWVGFDNFKFLFSSDKVLRVTWNTVFLNAMFIFFQQAIAFVTALFLNEVGSKVFKKVTQSFIFLPYFISWIVVSVFAYNLFASEGGLLNSILAFLHIPEVAWGQRADLWPGILVLFSIWKYAGFLTVIYIAAITGVNTEYFESAALDGATKLQQIRYITLPVISPTITIMVLLSVGRIFYGDFGMIYALVGDNASLYATTDVIDTFVYRSLRTIGDAGMSSAAGLYQSVVGFILVLGFNALVKKYKSEGSLF
ncbi:ABC transporter permease [Paenibacillus sp. Soil724D2]|uniref:ABC transporter permease n=1 Tax=Paenibacillus sp. (strain Soil724D2) TaxID=1736392 RepID=UPI000A66F004|nr:ABC transporter permease subunit [Paenibacillus sp. Soil724D2]